MISSFFSIAPAKINLSLRILGKREDGYHELETLMAPITLADEIQLQLIPDNIFESVSLSCNDVALPTNKENLCVRAAYAFQDATNLRTPITISLQKKIPYGAGLGGGSSDAAAVLRGMNMLFEEPLCFEELHQIATTIGSDVPFFLDPKPRYCRGRGELLGEAVSLADWKLLLIKPPFPIAAAEAYSRLQVAGCRLQVDTTLLDGIPIFNDLEAPVFGKYFQLLTLKSWLQACPKIAAAWMTGSGSTMVAALKKEISKEEILHLQQSIIDKFGSSFWIKETTFI